MDNETLEYRVSQMENKLDKISDRVEIINALEVKFTQLNSSLDKLSKQFEDFSNTSSNRSYEWLKYLATLIIGAAFTYIVKK